MYRGVAHAGCFLLAMLIHMNADHGSNAEELRIWCSRASSCHQLKSGDVKLVGVVLKHKPQLMSEVAQKKQVLCFVSTQ